MSSFYVACELGLEGGCVSLGTLHHDRLNLSEVRRFPNVPLVEKGSVHLDFEALYREVLEGLRSIGSYEEPVAGISCTSWGGDYLLFGSDGSVMAPVYHQDDPRTEAAVKKVLEAISKDALYAETGLQVNPHNSLFGLGAETGRRLKQTAFFLPIADAFNYFLTGVAKAELSQASTTQLFNPQTQAWSEAICHAVRLPPKLLPQLVAAGTDLAPLRSDLVADTKLEDARVIASCSHELAAALAGLPLPLGEQWACLQPGPRTLVATQIAKPLVNEVSRDLGFNNQLGYRGDVVFAKESTGLLLLEQCQRFWQASDRALDWELLVHLAGSASPFESLIDPSDARFSVPGDMPLKVQAFCKETGQSVPRKPGAVFRCILESLALQHRKNFQELEYLAGAKFSGLYLLGSAANYLFHHFIANALGIPVMVAPANLAAIGNMIVQALALGHIKTLEHAHRIVQESFKFTSIVPQSTAWDAAYDRFLTLAPEPDGATEEPVTDKS